MQTRPESLETLDLMLDLPLAWHARMGVADLAQTSSKEIAVLTWLVIGFLLILSGYAVMLGASEIPKEARQTQAPEYLEGLQKQLDDTKNAGLIVLLCTLTYILVWLVLH